MSHFILNVTRCKSWQHYMDVIAVEVLRTQEYSAGVRIISSLGEKLEIDWSQ